MQNSVGIGYVVGIVVSIIVIRHRAGAGWGRIYVFGPGGVGPMWMVLASLAIAFWPVALAIWLLRGRPEPAMTFMKV